MSELVRLLKQNIRDYAMIIALFVIIIFFSIATQGVFISPRNVTDLLNQTGYIAVLAIGMTLVIVVKEIDLSVGFISGFLGAIIAIMLGNGVPLIPVLLVAIIIGGLIGIYNGSLVAAVGIPSFVATLASMLIFRGLLQYITSGQGTIIVDDAAFNALGDGFIPPTIFGINIGAFENYTTILIGIIGIAFYVYSEIKNRKIKKSYGFEVLSNNLFLLKVVFISLFILIVVINLANYSGISWTVVIVLIVTFVYNFITTKTPLGRHIYAVGGNPEAAELSGISVKKIKLIVYASMGVLSAIAGILYTARLKSASTTAGTLFELDAIAAAYVGGVSAAGGVGKVTNSVIGALVLSSLISGMNLLGVDNSLQYIIKGIVLVIAVVFDVTTRNKVK